MVVGKDGEEKSTQEEAREEEERIKEEERRMEERLAILKDLREDEDDAGNNEEAYQSFLEETVDQKSKAVKFWVADIDSRSHENGGRESFSGGDMLDVSVSAPSEQEQICEEPQPPSLLPLPSEVPFPADPTSTPPLFLDAPPLSLPPHSVAFRADDDLEGEEDDDDDVLEGTMFPSDPPSPTALLLCDEVAASSNFSLSEPSIRTTEAAAEDAGADFAVNDEGPRSTLSGLLSIPVHPTMENIPFSSRGAHWKVLRQRREYSAQVKPQRRREGVRGGGDGGDNDGGEGEGVGRRNLDNMGIKKTPLEAKEGPDSNCLHISMESKEWERRGADTYEGDAVTVWEKTLRNNDRTKQYFFFFFYIFFIFYFIFFFFFLKQG
jgi:hypothetical protein